MGYSHAQRLMSFETAFTFRVDFCTSPSLNSGGDRELSYQGSRDVRFGRRHAFMMSKVLQKDEVALNQQVEELRERMRILRTSPLRLLVRASRASFSPMTDPRHPSPTHALFSLSCPPISAPLPVHSVLFSFPPHALQRTTASPTSTCWRRTRTPTAMTSSACARRIKTCARS
jgi:hypothetical protein